MPPPPQSTERVEVVVTGTTLPFDPPGGSAVASDRPAGPVGGRGPAARLWSNEAMTDASDDARRHAPSTLRVRLDLAYDGAAFSGWAAQPGLRTVEGVLTAALSTVLRVPVRLTVAGRTDAGVHAAAQVAHLDVPVEAWRALPGRSDRTPAQALATRLAGVLARRALAGPRGAADVVITGARVVPDGFDARFSALRRRYAYRIADAVSPHDPLRRGHVLWVRDRLDVEAMEESAAPLLGEHDFLSYCRPRAGATTIRTLSGLTWRRESGPGGDAGLVVLSATADAFCHSMVRSLVGAGLAVGRGSRPPAWPGELLTGHSREVAAPVAPPHGLILEAVDYPDDDDLAGRAVRARRLRRPPAGGAAAIRGGDCC